MIELFKNGNDMAIRTDAADEGEFIRQLSGLLGNLMDKNIFADDWAFQLEILLPEVVDICCKYRGYKAPNVIEQRVLIAGASSPPDVEPMARVTDKGMVIYGEATGND